MNCGSEELPVIQIKSGIHPYTECIIQYVVTGTSRPVTEYYMYTLEGTSRPVMEYLEGTSRPSPDYQAIRRAIEGSFCQETSRPEETIQRLKETIQRLECIEAPEYQFQSSKYFASEHGSSIYGRSSGYGTSGYPTNTRTQKMQVLKQYDWIKEQLYWRDIISVTDNLYRNGHLKHHELDEIQDRYQPRRKAADILLKIVLKNPSTVSAFMKILESKSHLLYIAERINKTKISARGMKSLDNPLSQTRMKTSHNQQRSASDAVKKVISSLRNATVMQKLNSHARKNLDLEFKEAVKGSMGITFVFSVVEPCQELKHPFAIGPDIFAQRMFQAYCDLDDQEPQQFEL